MASLLQLIQKGIMAKAKKKNEQVGGITDKRDKTARKATAKKAAR